MGLEILAQQSLTTAAVEAFTAELRVIRANAVTNGEALHVLSDRGDNTNSLVA